MSLAEISSFLEATRRHEGRPPSLLLADLGDSSEEENAAQEGEKKKSSFLKKRASAMFRLRRVPVLIGTILGAITIASVVVGVWRTDGKKSASVSDHAQRGLSSDAQREATPSGETWRATTHARALSGWITIREEVRLDRNGHLAYADTTITTTSSDDKAAIRTLVVADAPALRFAARIVALPGEHRVIVTSDYGHRDQGQHAEWSVPVSLDEKTNTDQPWILAPVRLPSGEVIPTPLVAWTTWRATRGSASVHLITPLEQRSVSVPSDQYVIDQTVIVGESAINVDDQFIRSIPINGVELARGAGDIHGAFRFRGG